MMALQLSARDKWKAEHRARRMRQQGKSEDEIRGFVSHIGTWEGVRIIVTSERD